VAAYRLKSLIAEASLYEKNLYIVALAYFDFAAGDKNKFFI
jgi:hypothetical protein